MEFVFNDSLEAQKWVVLNINNNFVHSYSNGTYMFKECSEPVETNRVLEVEDLGYHDDYVYDIETEDGTFHAGVGQLIIKNTDSIYTKFIIPNQDTMDEDEKLRKIYEVSEQCAKRISDTFKKPIDLEMEDLKYPIALFSKKTYVYRQLTKSRDGSIKDDGVVVKGVQTVRRGSCGYVRKVCNPIMDELMYGRDVEKAKVMARESVRNLLDNRVDIADLVVTMSLKDKYKSENKAGHKMSPPAHWCLAQKMNERDPGTAPRPGSRVPYVFIQTKNKNDKNSERVEDPEWVLRFPKTCKIDLLHYLDKQLSHPLATIFQVVITNRDGELFPLGKDGKISKEYKKEVARQLWEDLRKSHENKSKGQKQISDFFKPQIIDDLESVGSDDEIYDSS